MFGSGVGDSIFKQRDGSVEDWVFRCGIFGVVAEVAEAFELEGSVGIGEGRFEFAIGESLERIRVEVVGEVAAILDLIGVFGGEEAIVQAYLGLEGVGSGDPVNGALDLATVGGVSASGGGIVGAAQFGDFAVLVLDDFSAGDVIGVLEAYFYFTPYFTVA